MKRRLLVGMVVAGAVVAGLGGASGCRSLEERTGNPYIGEFGKQGDIEDAPPEVQEFVRSTYPEAAVERIYEKRHKSQNRIQTRHFEIHMVMPGGRKKVIEYNTFMKPSVNVETLERYEPQGSGTSKDALKPGENP